MKRDLACLGGAVGLDESTNFNALLCNSNNCTVIKLLAVFGTSWHHGGTLSLTGRAFPHSGLPTSLVP